MFAFAVAAAALFVDPGSFERAVYLPSATPERAVSTPASLPAADEPAPLSGVMVTVECTAYADGHVGACTVMEETHPGLGFGTAAIALMNGSEAEQRADNVQFARTIVFVP